MSAAFKYRQKVDSSYCGDHLYQTDSSVLTVDYREYLELRNFDFCGCKSTDQGSDFKVLSAITVKIKVNGQFTIFSKVNNQATNYVAISV